MGSPLLVEGMQGLGDNLYQRAVLREVQKERPVYLVTAWPQLYADLPNVRVLKSPTRLRTQAKNAARPGPRWASPPVGAQRLRWHYVGGSGSILESLCAEIGHRPAGPLDMGGPPVDPVGVGVDGPYVVVRPATVRTEWPAEARNPRPEYLAQAAAEARRRGYRVVSVADLAPGVEWAIDPLPVADVTLHHGQLPVEHLLALVAGASAVIGGVGWLLPAALAYRRPMLLVYGGWGYYNNPERLLGPLVDSSLIHAAQPAPFCRCKDHAHRCHKEVHDYAGVLAQWRF